MEQGHNNTESKDRLIDRINNPADLKKLEIDDLESLAAEIRDLIIETVARNGGHLAPNLGVVELTIALHYVFNSPQDKIIWDVGHQAYAHKILTGRKNRFHTNRQYKGISGFPKMEESEYDAYGGGHSSVSISAALGMAVAAEKKGEENRKIVAVIGDGSLSGGVAFEGLNNAGAQRSDLLVILNDNNIAIDPNMGALQEYLVDIVTSKTYNFIRTIYWKILDIIGKVIPSIKTFIEDAEQSVKRLVMKRSELFESFRFRYFGPVDGHNIAHLVKIFRDMRDIPGPKLLHIVTKKGKGYIHAEQNQAKWHAVEKFDKHTGQPIKSKPDGPQPPKFQEVFGHTLLELAEMNPGIIGITPAMLAGSSMNIMKDKYPRRVFDVGICEQHAVTFSAGLATQGMVPFCHIYSTFFQRAYDQLIHDVALQKLNVIFCLDRAGLVGSDGPTHHGAYDIAFLRCIPGMTICSPMNEQELRNMMYTAQLPDKGPFAIRYPRGNGVMVDWKKPFREMLPGKGRKIKEGEDVAILSLGPVGNFVQQAISMLSNEKASIAHYDMRFVKPLDEEMLHEVFKKFRHIITIEDGTVKGGFGSSVLEFKNEHGYQGSLKILGMPDEFIEQGSQEELYRECGYDVDSIYTILQSYSRLGISHKAI
jgi:1-deoxy-D-xylulose-5-phosphate synthase